MLFRSSLIVANALLATKEYAALRILGSIDIDPMRFSFGASRQSWPLITILNKALINIPPEDLHALTRGGSAGSSFDSTGPRQIALSTALTVGMVTAFLLLVVAGYGYRRHLRSPQTMLGIITAHPHSRRLAQRVTLEKSAFLATISHSILTPIVPTPRSLALVLKRTANTPQTR